MNFLNDRRGASLAWALLLLLICALAGGAVMNAAAAGLGRFERGPEYYRECLCAESAAGLVADSIKSAEKISAIFGEAESFSYGNAVSPDDGDFIYLIWEELKSALRAGFYSSPDYRAAHPGEATPAVKTPEKKTFTVEVSGDDRFLPAAVEIDFGESFDEISFAVSCGDCKITFKAGCRVKTYDVTYFGGGAELVFDADGIVFKRESGEAKP